MKLSMTIAACVLLMAAPAFSQINATSWPAAFSTWQYAAGEADTSREQHIAGSNLLSLTVTPADTAALDIVVQYKRNGTWETILTDSLVTASGTGTTQEFWIRSKGTDLIDGIYFPLRVIISARATGNGVTSPMFGAAWKLRV